MNNKLLAILPLVLTATVFSQQLPLTNDAKVFADFSDEQPKTISYFSSKSEEDIKRLYQSHYGNVDSEVRIRGHLQLLYSTGEHEIRVIISTQGEKREVNLMQIEKSN